jgi:hypothetical protein
MWMARVASNGLILGCGVRPSAFGPCPLWVRRVGFVTSAVCPVYPQHQTFPDPVGTSHLRQMQTFDRHQSDARGSSAQVLPSAKSSLLHSFENMIARFLRAELSGERPGVKEWP